MLETKILEIRDRATTVVALATALDTDPEVATPQGRWLLRRAGFADASFNDIAFTEIVSGDVQRPFILLAPITGGTEGRANYDPFKWGDRTFKTAHRYIAENWEDIDTYTVIDVEFILGETDKPKRSERFTPLGT